MSHRFSQRINQLNQAIKECRQAIVESEAALTAASRRSSEPNASLQCQLTMCFYQQELRELKTWLFDAEQKRDQFREQETMLIIAGSCRTPVGV